MKTPVRREETQQGVDQRQAGAAPDPRLVPLGDRGAAVGAPTGADPVGAPSSRGYMECGRDAFMQGCRAWTPLGSPRYWRRSATGQPKASAICHRWLIFVSCRPLSMRWMVCTDTPACSDSPSCVRLPQCRRSRIWEASRRRRWASVRDGSGDTR